MTIREMAEQREEAFLSRMRALAKTQKEGIFRKNRAISVPCTNGTATAFCTANRFAG